MLTRLFSLPFLRFLGLVIASAALCQAQSLPAGTVLHGRVLDPNRAAIVGARITLEGKGRSGGSVRTNGNGEFSLVVEPGEYSLKVTADGFADSSQRVSSGAAGFAPVEIVLQIAESSATVNVTDTAGYQTLNVSSATRTLTALRDIPQSIAVVTREQIREQSMGSIADVVSYVPGITSHQGENNRDQIVIRGNSSSADFFLNGVRDDVQYYRDLYNVERVEALKGPNAMIFGRGGGGGVINRATKEAGFSRLREVTVQGGSFRNKRFTIDLNQPFNNRIAFRLNGLYENAASFRSYVNQERYGINPTVTLAPGPQTRIALSYEYFHDRRVADRGIPSYQGRPVDVPISTYFGNPNDSRVRASVNLASATIEHQTGGLNIRNRTMLGDYDRGYQNYVPGTVPADKTQVALSAYNNATRRRNIFNQTDLSYGLRTGRVRHTFLAGAEIGRQSTDNLRHTGFFNNTSTSILAPLTNPTIYTPVTFRQNATDANNHLRTNLLAAYAQDQIELSHYVQIIAVSTL